MSILRQMVVKHRSAKRGIHLRVVALEKQYDLTPRLKLLDSMRQRGVGSAYRSRVQDIYQGVKTCQDEDSLGEYH